MDIKKEVIVVPDNMAKKEWFTSAEFAAGLRLSKKAFNEWLRVHPDFKDKFCQKIGGGEKKPRYLINWKGVAEYISQKSQNNQKSQNIRHFKSGVAEQANQNIERERSQDPMIANLQMMIEMREGQLALNSKVEILEKKIDTVMAVATTPVPVTNGQRQFLNERVRKYCIEHDLPFHVVWRQVHEHVGLAAVHKYELRHYQAALKYVEKMYRETGLIW